ncbi:MAG TPA: VOC family protein [Allosphingosinicella sp.]
MAHYGLRTRNLAAAVDWYGKAFGARALFQSELMAFMTFDEEHHRFVIWDDGETAARPGDAAGVDHVGYSCGGPGELAEEYERLKAIGVTPFLAVNHGFTSSLYYHDPDGNEVEITCDNFPTKAECAAWLGSEEAVAAMQPPCFGSEFDPERLGVMRAAGASAAEMARVGL